MSLVSFSSKSTYISTFCQLRYKCDYRSDEDNSHTSLNLGVRVSKIRKILLVSCTSHLLSVALAAIAPERGGLGVGPALLALSLSIGVESVLHVIHSSHSAFRFD